MATATTHPLASTHLTTPPQSHAVATTTNKKKRKRPTIPSGYYNITPPPCDSLETKQLFFSEKLGGSNATSLKSQSAVDKLPPTPASSTSSSSKLPTLIKRLYPGSSQDCSLFERTLALASNAPLEGIRAYLSRSIAEKLSRLVEDAQHNRIPGLSDWERGRVELLGDCIEILHLPPLLRLRGVNSGPLSHPSFPNDNKKDRARRREIVNRLVTTGLAFVFANHGDYSHSPQPLLIFEVGYKTEDISVPDLEDRARFNLELKGRMTTKAEDFCGKGQGDGVRIAVLVYVTHPDVSEVYITVSRRNSENGETVLLTSTQTQSVEFLPLEDEDQDATRSISLSLADFLPSDIIALAFPKGKDGARVCDALNIDIAFQDLALAIYEARRQEIKSSASGKRDFGVLKRRRVDSWGDGFKDLKGFINLCPS